MEGLTACRVAVLDAGEFGGKCDPTEMSLGYDRTMIASRSLLLEVASKK